LSLVEHVALGARALRKAGVRVGLSDEIDAVQALARVDIGDREEVRWALRCALKIRPRDVAAFERWFAATWRRVTRTEARTEADADADADAGAETGTEAESERRGLAASLQPALRRKPFEHCTDAELAQMEPVLARLAAQLATRRSRRLVPTRGRGRPDLRRSLRRAVGTGGELLWLARRTRPIERPRLVVLCDISGSMAAHARFIVAFARALARVARRTEIFTFDTTLTRLGSDARVPQAAGGTRIGACLARFVDDHLDALVDGRTVVIIFSDGLERDDPAELARALRRIHARARRVLWLNPLLSDPDFEPTARGMAAALPYVDQLAPAHDLASLERLIPEL
jgi:uncharacterized protein with von Willebrand factor type A (vWA) domain